jgi:integrase
MWHTALQVAGLPSVPLHSARHTTASLLREMGVKEDVRMQILGHASPQVTAGYTHLGDAETIDAMRMLGELVMPSE